VSVIIRPYRAGDVFQVEALEARLGELMALDAADRELLGIGWTAELNGAAISAGALVQQWRGYAHAIMLVGALQGMQQLRLVAAASRRIVARSAFRRVDAFVRADFAAGLRFAEWVGFQRVTLLRAYGADGADHYLFERVAPAELGMAA
jgi:hypothetical protein